ncbi:DUF2252 family protein [Silvibacterium acidisoli]|uniref:DUF2252 family protein n=1 Tax=Acidobacteriaceae bacterium ZG23-2 TaxID=2883246 RepID=UPI00406CDF82
MSQQKKPGPARKKQANGVPHTERSAVLQHTQRTKMAQSAHRYVRGSTVKFYEWLLRDHSHLVPDGPPVWICGDCHLGNLGPVASHEGKVEVEIRDVDQTVIGNPAHDIVRLGLSLASAARGNDLPGATTAYMLEHMVEGYLAAMHRPHATAADDAKGDDLEPIQVALRTSLKRRWRHLAEERIEGVEPVIPLGKRFWALTDEERASVDALVEEENTLAMIRKLAGDREPRKVKVIDAAYWMKGCSSLGKLRYAVLLGVGKGDDREYRLIDIKEAVDAAAPATDKKALAKLGIEQPKNFADRVVTGARALSPFLGERMLAATLLRRPVVMRELMPQDLKLEIDTLTRAQAVGAARFLAAVVGKAHARQMNAATRKQWMAELKKNRSKSLDAPSWLWRSVVELMGEHEVAYLEHCRRYAME